MNIYVFYYKKKDKRKLHIENFNYKDTWLLALFILKL